MAVLIIQTIFNFWFMINFWLFKILGLIAVLFEAYDLNAYLYLNTVRYEFKKFLHIKYTFK